MMKRFCSQFIFCSPDEIQRQVVVEQNEFGVITDLFPLNQRHPEPAHTLFIDGIISGGIRSLKQQLSFEKLRYIQNKYQYIDLSNGVLPLETDRDERKLVFDFGTNEITTINELFRLVFPFLHRFPIFDIIAACVYYPALLSEEENELERGVKTELLQWRGVDLVSKKITERTKIVNLTQ